MSHVHGSEDLILLKWSNCPEPFADIMQPEPKYQSNIYNELGKLHNNKNKAI